MGGLAFQPRLRNHFEQTGFDEKLSAFEKKMDTRTIASLPEAEKQQQIARFDKAFLHFFLKHNILVEGPAPAEMEYHVKGAGKVIWIPKQLFLLTQ